MSGTVLQQRAQAILAALVLVLAGFTAARNALWRDPLALWRDALSHAPDKARVNYQLGREYGKAGDTEQAFRYMRKAKEKDPSFFSGLLARAESFRRQGKLKEAAEEYRKAVEHDPDRPVLHNDLGAVLYGMDRKVEAYIEFSEAVRIDPTYAMAHANRGVINVEWNALDDAIRDYRRAVELQPGNSSFHAKLGYAYLKKGMLGESLAAYDTALRLDPQNERALRERDLALRQWLAGGGKNRPRGH